MKAFWRAFCIVFVYLAFSDLYVNWAVTFAFMAGLLVWDPDAPGNEPAGRTGHSRLLFHWAPLYR